MAYQSIQLVRFLVTIAIVLSIVTVSTLSKAEDDMNFRRIDRLSLLLPDWTANTDGDTAAERAEVKLTNSIEVSGTDRTAPDTAVTTSGINAASILPTIEVRDDSILLSERESRGDIDINVLDNDGAADVYAVNSNTSDVGRSVAGSNGGVFTIQSDGSLDFDTASQFDHLDHGQTATTSITYSIRTGDQVVPPAAATNPAEGITISVLAIDPRDVLPTKGSFVASAAISGVLDDGTITITDTTDLTFSDDSAGRERARSSGSVNGQDWGDLATDNEYKWVLENTETGERITVFQIDVERFWFSSTKYWGATGELEAGVTYRVVSVNSNPSASDGVAYDTMLGPGNTPSATEDTATVTVIVTGVNDAAVIGGDDKGAVTEDASAPTLTDNGALTITDSDAGEAAFVAESVAGTYGSLSIDAAGNWTYAADNDQTAIQSLDAGATLTDTLTVSAVDGTQHDIVVNITAAGDVEDNPFGSSADLISGVGLANPSLAMGLAGIKDWSTQMPFIDVMKQARTWKTSVSDESGTKTVSYDYLKQHGFLDADGWPTAIPEGADKMVSYLAWGSEEAIGYRAGRYVVEYEGEGTLKLLNGTVVERGPGRIVWEISEAKNYGFIIEETDPAGTGNYIRNISMVREEHVELHEAGAIFNPDWIALIENLRTVRFMDWMGTNHSDQSEWVDRPQVEDAFWQSKSMGGVPVEIMVALANQIGADPWFNIPHLATDEYIREFAIYVRDHLDPDLKAHIEFSNEVWNFKFQQAKHSNLEGKSEIGDVGSAWVQNYGMDAAHMAQIWTKVFGDSADTRLVKVLGTHTAYTALATAVLEAPNYAELDPNFTLPYQHFDAWAVTGYFNGLTNTVDGISKVPTVKQWIEESIARSTGQEDKYDYAIKLAIQEIRDGSVTGDARGGLKYLNDLFQYHAGIAETYGLDLVMYEGGSHVVGLGSDVNDAELTEFLIALHESEGMAELYKEVLVLWDAAGGQSFNAFQDVAAHGKYGSWGALQSLDDNTPRWDVLMQENQTRDADWETRESGTFEHGVTRIGDDSNNQMFGTSEEDFLIGRAGNDRLESGAADDGLNGGAGNDLLIGGTGRDTLVGGKGNDQFLYENPDDLGDLIADFASGSDQVVFSAQSFKFDYTGALNAADFSVGLGFPVELAGNQPQFYLDTKEGHLWFDATGGSSDDMQLVATFGAHVPDVYDIILV